MTMKPACAISSMAIVSKGLMGQRIAQVLIRGGVFDDVAYVLAARLTEIGILVAGKRGTHTMKKSTLPFGDRP